MILERHFETLKKMFFEEVIRHLTVDIVCSRISIAKKTFYKDFANRRELVDALFHKDFFGFRQELKKRLPGFVKNKAFYSFYFDALFLILWGF